MFLDVLSAGALVVGVHHCIGWLRNEWRPRGDDDSTQQLLDAISSGTGARNDRPADRSAPAVPTLRHPVLARPSGPSPTPQALLGDVRRCATVSVALHRPRGRHAARKSCPAQDIEEERLNGTRTLGGARSLQRKVCPRLRTGHQFRRPTVLCWAFCFGNSPSATHL